MKFTEAPLNQESCSKIKIQILRRDKIITGINQIVLKGRIALKKQEIFKHWKKIISELSKTKLIQGMTKQLLPIG